MSAQQEAKRQESQTLSPISSADSPETGGEQGPNAAYGASAHDVLRTHLLRRRRDRVVTHTAQVVLLVSFLATWQLLGSAGAEWSRFLGTPVGVYDYLVQSLLEGDIWPHLGATLAATLVSFLLGSAAGVASGLSLAMFPLADRILKPFITALNSMPRIALGPLFLLVLGIGMEAKVALAFSVVYFIVLESTRAGAKSVDEEYLRVARAYGSSKSQLFSKVLFPYAIPSIFGALRLAIVYSLLGVIISEFIAARSGMGVLLVRASHSFNIDGIYGLLVVLVAVSTALSWGTGFLEKRLLRWQPE